MKKLLLTLMLGMFLISSVSAYSPHKQRTDWEVTISSNNATDCNVSYVQLPNGTLRYINGEMEQNGNSFNYTLTWGNFTIIGDTCVGIACTDGVTDETGSICRDITSSGFNGTLGFYFIILGIGAGLIMLGFKIEDHWIVVLGGFSIIFVGLFITFYGIDIIKDEVYTYALGIIVGMTGAYFSIRGAYEALHA